MSIQIFGLPVSRGIAIGRAMLMGSSRVDVAHYFIDEPRVEHEIDRLRAARDVVATELEGLKRDLPREAPSELGALLDVHLMLLHDPMISDALRQWIAARHYNAEWAVTAQTEVLVRQFEEMDDPYLRERKHDIEQVAERLLRGLRRMPTALPQVLESHDLAGADPLVLVANDISPADMLQFKGSVFQGFITDVGGRTSHTAIVARSMDIPAVVGAREASRLVRQDDWVIIDGEAGVVLVNPSAIVLEEYRFKQRESELVRARLDRLRNMPSITLDGESIELHANIELPRDTAAALHNGAVGVGLFRSEFLFMNRNGELPDEEEQFVAYRAAIEAMGGLPVTIRTVDIGADKPMDRMSQQDLRREHALNPALGLRAIRWSLSEPYMFGEQLRAILRASAFGKVRLLIPMIAHVSEVRATLAAVGQAKARLEELGQPYSEVEIGAMVEVPAAALAVRLLLRHFDFVAIGTNDLIQYSLAIDRADESVAYLYDPWHPSIIHMIQNVITEANRVGKSVSVCGEMAGDPAFTELLIGMGLRTLSMHPTQIPSIKQRVLRADAKRLQGAVSAALQSDEPAQVWPGLLAAVQGRHH